jgi:hypothetical protein
MTTSENPLQAALSPKEEAPEGWRYSINYGPEGEENWANVYCHDRLVGNFPTWQAKSMVAHMNEPTPPKGEPDNG